MSRVANPVSEVKDSIETAKASVLLGDPRTTNILLLVITACMAGLMPEQFQAICG